MAKRPHRMTSTCWCAPTFVGIVDGMSTYRHHDRAGDFIRSAGISMTVKEAQVGFGKRVARFRAGAGLTQRQLAKMLDATENYVYQLEAGNTAPSIGMLQTIAEVFGLSVDDLLDGIRFPRREKVAPKSRR